jgi:predicted secreted acid phosphatase
MKVVVTDLDETLITNVGFYKHSADWSPEAWDKWIRSGRKGSGPYNKSVLDLIQKAQDKGFSIMFITGRPASQAEATLRQMHGIQWDWVLFRTARADVPFTLTKDDFRRLIEKMGYTIVLTIGDQTADMDQPVLPSVGRFLLPNVMYSIP